MHFELRFMFLNKDRIRHTYLIIPSHAYEILLHEINHTNCNYFKLTNFMNHKICKFMSKPLTNEECSLTRIKHCSNNEINNY